MFGAKYDPLYPHWACQLLNRVASWIVSVTGSKNNMLSVSVILALPAVKVNCPTHPRTGKSSNLYLGFQCFSADTITSFLFATSFDQLSFPDFHGDLVEGLDISMPTATFAKFSAVFVWIIHNFPDWLLKITSPRLNGLVGFRKASFESRFRLVWCKVTFFRHSGPRSRAS